MNKPKDMIRAGRASKLRRFTPRWSLDVSLKLLVYTCLFVVLVFAFHYLLFRDQTAYPVVTFWQRAGEYALPNKYEYGVDSFVSKGAHQVSYQEQCTDSAGSMTAGGHTSDWWLYMPEYGGFVNEVNVAGVTDNQPLHNPAVPIRHGSCY